MKEINNLSDFIKTFNEIMLTLDIDDLKKKRQLAKEEMEMYDYILDNLYKLKTKEIKEFSVDLSNVIKISNKVMIKK